jgi:rhodanese-related sulfurtransferase
MMSPSKIDREGVRRSMREGAQLVEVLPRAEYDEDHLPGARHLPLREIETRARVELDAERPVIVYCWDSA